MNKYRIDFNEILQPYTKTDKIYFQLPMDVQQALEYCRYMIQQELNLPAQDIYNGFQLYEVLDYKTCPNCGRTFQPDHGNKKYCSDECSKNANKIKNAERVKKYLSIEENRKKHLLRMATDRLIKKDLIQKTNCVKCGSENKLEFHHFYYANDFKTVGVYLCKKCHCELHNNLRKGN